MRRQIENPVAIAARGVSQADRAGKLIGSGDKPRFNSAQVLRHGSRLLIRIVPDDAGPLYRIEWPDIGLSAPVNLTRAREAARLWAEAQYLRENRRQRALKSLRNFSWSSAPVRKSQAA
jgi:hypothetical protein